MNDQQGCDTPLGPVRRGSAIEPKHLLHRRIVSDTYRAAPVPTVVVPAADENGDDELTRLRATIEVERTRADNLEVALQSNRQIGIAIGIVMSQRQVGLDEAFDILVAVSQSANLKLRVVAEHVIYTGSLDTVPGPPRVRRRRSPAK